ncbi:MAG: hypothetical protein PQJ35_01350, partial [Sphaerochaetaceae bacterium]|nr:hypothetical protein [Sphaerochaetaceae bacterium]
EEIYRSSLVAFILVEENGALLNALTSIESKDEYLPECKRIEIAFLRVLSYVFGLDYIDIVNGCYDTSTDAITFEQDFQEWVDAGLENKTPPYWLKNI